MKKLWIVFIACGLEACAGNVIPAPNSMQTHFDPQQRSVQVLVSDVQPAAAVDLIGPDGSRYPATAVTLVSGPHVDYKPPPSIGIGIGGLGFSGCCTGFGSGLGVGLPLGGPTPSHVSDQYVASAAIPVPADYAQRWASYRVEVRVGTRPVVLAAPAPS